MFGGRMIMEKWRLLKERNYDEDQKPWIKQLKQF